MTPKLDRLFPRETAAHPLPLASVRAYRRAGCVIVTVERAGRAPQPHRVSLRRHSLRREWITTRAPIRWSTSGWWARSSIAVSLWRTRT